MTVKEGFIEVTGGKVWYQIHNEEGKESPLIILHGGPGSSHFSLQDLKALAVNRPVIFYDQLGCGQSDRPNDNSLWTLDRFVEELHQIKESLKLNEFHILGHSWGTTLAAQYYFTYPDGVKSIIFSSPCLSAPIWAADQRDNLKQLPEEIQQIIMDYEESGTEKVSEEDFQRAIQVFGETFVCRLNPYPARLSKPEFRNREIYNIMWGPSEFTVKGNLKDFDCTEQLKNIKIPTLYTCGRYDEATPKSTEYFSSLTPNSKFHVFENSSHMAYAEEFEEYVRGIGEFLNSLD